MTEFWCIRNSSCGMSFWSWCEKKIGERPAFKNIDEAVYAHNDPTLPMKACPQCLAIIHRFLYPNCKPVV